MKKKGVARNKEGSACDHIIAVRRISCRCRSKQHYRFAFTALQVLQNMSQTY